MKNLFKNKWLMYAIILIVVVVVYKNRYKWGLMADNGTTGAPVKIV